MKFIKRKSAVKPITGSIVDTTNIDDKTTNTYSANVIDGLLEKVYFSWYEFKGFTVSAGTSQNFIDAHTIKASGRPIFISISITAMVDTGNWSLYLYVDREAKQRLLSADNHSTPLNYTNSTIIDYINKGTHTIEFKIVADGTCTVPNYNQHSIVFYEI